MTDYTKTTDFTSKDSLPSGDSGKIIRGAEFGTEFDNIETAVNSKSNKENPSFTGNITVTGTVDGRDIAADGTKLDTVETSADVTDTANVTAAGAVMDSELTNIAAVKALNQGVATTNSPTFAAVTSTGNVTVGGTVDGRDVAADGTKLDGIEAGATADQTAAQIKTAYESNANTNAFTDADHTKLDGIEALADVTDTTNVTAAGALMDSELTSIASVKALNQGVATTNSPTFAGATVNGTVEFDGLSGTGAVTVTDILDQDNMSSNSATALATQQSIKSYVDSQVATSDTLAEVLANGNATGGTDVAFGANDKALFGAGSDLQVYHSGSSSFITDVGTGDLRIRSNKIRMEAPDSQNMIIVTEDAGLQAFYNGTQRLEVTNTGIDVTGNVTIPTGNKVAFDTDGQTYISEDIDERLRFWVANTEFMRMTNTTTDEIRLLPYGGNLFSGGNLDVTGTVSADGLTVDSTASFSYLPVSTAGSVVGAIGTGSSVIFNTPSVNASYGSGLAIDGSHASDLSSVNIKAFGPKFSSYGSELNLFTSDDTSLLKRQTIASNGDISFYEDTGTTAKLFWDASAESLGIGTSSVGAKLHVLSGTDNNIAANVSEVRFIGADKVITGEQANLVIQTNDNMAINKGGSIGLGGRHTTSSTNSSNFAQISGRKENGTSANFAGYLAFGTSDSASDIHERMRIDSSGNVGIGTSSPSSKLDVQGGLAISNSSASRWTLDRDNTNGSLTFTDSYINEAMRIDGASGSLLVGTTDVAPAVSNSEVGVALSGSLGYVAASRSAGASGFFNRLSDGDIVTFNKDGTTVGSIASVGGADIKVNFSSDGDQYITGNAAANYLSFSSANAERMRIDSSGNVNISTGHLRVALGSDEGSQLNLWSESNGEANVAAYTLKFKTGGNNSRTEAMRIDSNRKLLVGTTYASLFDTSTQANAGALIDGVNDNVQIARWQGVPLYLNRMSTDGTIVDFRKSGASVGSVGVTSSATTYNTSSDQRLKDNIVDAPSASDDIDAIQVRSFDWKADGSHQKYGMVAQELQTVTPEAVSEGATEEEMMGVDYSKLVPMLVKEIQSLRARVAQLETN